MVPTSTSARPTAYRPEIEVNGVRTRLLTEQVRSIDTDFVVDDAVEVLTRRELAEAEHALAHYLGVQSA